MKKRIIGIFGAHLLQLGIQVGIGDVTMLLLFSWGFSLEGLPCSWEDPTSSCWPPAGHQLLQVQLLVV